MRILGWYDEHGPNPYMQITPGRRLDADRHPVQPVGFSATRITPRWSTAPERSGLYYVEQKGESGRWFSAPWVVAPGVGARPRRSPCCLSTNTWNAYNNFGGRSNYINPTGCRHSRPSTAARNSPATATTRRPTGPPDEAFLPLSFERPEPFNVVPEGAEPTTRSLAARATTSRRRSGACWPGWSAKASRYDVYADAQLDDGTLDLARLSRADDLGASGVLDPAAVRARKDWVDEQGGRLMYLGGNGLNCEVELPVHLRHADEATPRRRGRSISARRTRPTPVAGSTPGSTAAPAVRGRLLGVATTETGIMTAAPYRVVMPTGTGSSRARACGRGRVFGTAEPPRARLGGASGHETDKMTPPSPAGTVLLAKGLNPDDGGAEIVFRDTPSGGAVFSVGSIVWPASLLVDEGVSAITRNVLRRFLG